MVKTIGFAHTAGYTESGSMLAFLNKINPSVKWERLFPAYCKMKIVHGPKGSTPIRHRQNQSGITGTALIHELLNVLKKYKSDYQRLDAIVVTDDLDCGSPGDSVALAHQVRQVLGKDIPCIYLYASPEVEAWFIADWKNSFEKSYPSSVANRLFHTLATWNPAVIRQTIEMFGTPAQTTGGCTNKLSTVIQQAMTRGFNGQRVYEYSKRYDGHQMLENIDPSVVATVCTRHFVAGYRDICSI